MLKKMKYLSISLTTLLYFIDGELLDVKTLNKWIKQVDIHWTEGKSGESFGSNLAPTTFCTTRYKSTECTEPHYAAACFNFCVYKNQTVDVRCVDKAGSDFCKSRRDAYDYVMQWKNHRQKFKSTLTQMLAGCYSYSICNRRDNMLSKVSDESVTSRATRHISRTTTPIETTTILMPSPAVQHREQKPPREYQPTTMTSKLTTVTMTTTSATQPSTELTTESFPTTEMTTESFPSTEQQLESTTMKEIIDNTESVEEDLQDLIESTKDIEMSTFKEETSTTTYSTPTVTPKQRTSRRNEELTTRTESSRRHEETTTIYIMEQRKEDRSEEHRTDIFTRPWWSSRWNKKKEEDRRNIMSTFDPARWLNLIQQIMG